MHEPAAAVLPQCMSAAARLSSRIFARAARDSSHCDRALAAPAGGDAHTRGESRAEPEAAVPPAASPARTEPEAAVRSSLR